MLHKTVKQSILFLSLFLLSCNSIRTVHYKVYAYEVISIGKHKGEYHVVYGLHIGKDADYYTINYYVDEQFLYGEKHNIGKSDAKHTNGYINEFLINEPSRVKVEVRTYIGREYYVTDTEIFYIDVK